EPRLVVLHDERGDEKVLRLDTGPLERPVEDLALRRLERPEVRTLRLRRLRDHGVVAEIVHRVSLDRAQSIPQPEQQRSAGGTESLHPPAHGEPILGREEAVFERQARAVSRAGEREGRTLRPHLHLCRARRQAPIRHARRVAAPAGPAAPPPPPPPRALIDQPPHPFPHPLDGSSPNRPGAPTVAPPPPP